MNEVVVFLDTLNTENQILEQLLDLAHHKRQVVISGDIKELEQLIKRENILLHSLNRCENQRAAVQLQVMKKSGFNESSLTAMEMIRRLESEYPEHSRAMRELVEIMALRMRALEDLNRLNIELIGQALAFIESMEALLTMTNDTTYSAQGTVPGVSSRPGLLDTRI